MSKANDRISLCHSGMNEVNDRISFLDSIASLQSDIGEVLQSDIGEALQSDNCVYYISRYMPDGMRLYRFAPE